ncbi:ECS1 [Arabidopsis thaliana]|uniref:ECS1 n=2 Tax=Arabidopsis TaxID=3701 RepID=A0A178WET3_ARATH|nr:ECS1 [Arabidopsis thaliana]
MFLFLLLLLVFPHIDNVLGARMEPRELGEINHADPLGFPVPIHVPPRFIPTRPVPRLPPYSPRRCPFCNPPPPSKAFPKNTPSH